MVATRQRKHELTDAEIAAVQLSNRQQYGEYTTFDALSRNGADRYVVTLNGDGRCVGCTCPATVRDCRHAQAAEFEFVWSAPSREEELAGAEIIGASVLGDDMTAHIDDSMGEMEAIAEQIIREQARKEKLAKQMAYREAFPNDFSDYCGYAA